MATESNSSGRIGPGPVIAPAMLTPLPRALNPQKEKRREYEITEGSTTRTDYGLAGRTSYLQNLGIMPRIIPPSYEGADSQGYGSQRLALPSSGLDRSSCYGCRKAA
ncbi:MAG: hypothetical protein KKD18_04110 [Nanoarchaeota archaeon]|nr:hypothetical protein [Nanoarchaeota archaeon]MBU0977575.1 hypothetical protein [Nanoarchaeota archaeon]